MPVRSDGQLGVVVLLRVLLCDRHPQVAGMQSQAVDDLVASARRVPRRRFTTLRARLHEPVCAMTRYRPSEAPAPEHDEILTTDEVAALLKIPKATLYKWVSQGTAPPFYKIGRVNRWKRSAVMAWFDTHLDEVSKGL
jgi:excisionase family DNA binding protein